MKMTGDLQKFAQFQGASSIPIAAANTGGAAGAGAGLGVGVAMGQAILSSASPTGGAGGDVDPVQKINQLHELLVKNIITQAEFDAKKAELLKRIT